MGGWQRVRRGAVVGLALTLLALTALSVTGAASTRDSAELVSRATALAAAYDRAHDAVAAEESLERKYRLEPGPEVRARHRRAGIDMQAALHEIDQRGLVHDRQLVVELRLLHGRYTAAIGRMFAAVDASAAAEVLRIDNLQVDPVFERISAMVQAATDEHIRAAARAVDRLHRVEGIVFASTAAGFAVGLSLLVAFAAFAGGSQRTLLRQAREGEHQALHDALTGLPNRGLFTDRLGHALETARRTGAGVAVLLFDLDRFKEVNDALGHQVGDLMLRQVAGRARTVLRAGDTVARLAGDEFAVLLPGADARTAGTLAERLLGALHRSFDLDDVTVDVEVSAGIALAPGHAGTAEALLRCADAALYEAKAVKTGVVLYRPEMHAVDAGRLGLLGDLRRALEADDQLVLHYQPKVNLGFEHPLGVEALLRWRHPSGGLVSPADFIPIAETTGLINQLTRHVLRLAMAQARAWEQEGMPVPVAVNLSARCLLDPDLLTDIRRLLGEVGLPAGLLRLEVTETAVMANPSLAIRTLTELHDLGIRLSIDDYGTGYSSLAYLKRLPVDELKIDRSFVLGLPTDRDDAVLVRGAIDLGHNLGLTVVAEGAETAAHVTALHELGCDIAQGFHYARPMPPERLADWIRARRPVTAPPVT